MSSTVFGIIRIAGSPGCASGSTIGTDFGASGVGADAGVVTDATADKGASGGLDIENWAFTLGMFGKDESGAGGEDAGFGGRGGVGFC